MHYPLLEGSWVYRLIERLLDGIVAGAKASGIARFILFVISRVRLYAQSSVIVRWCTRLADGFGRQLQTSGMIGRLLKEDTEGRYKEKGIVFRLYTVMLNLLRKLYHGLRISRLLEGSIFLKPWIWAGLTMIALPLLPTMVSLALVLLSACSLIGLMLHEREMTLRYFALNKYVWLYALVYALATLASVTRRESLNIGLITIVFILFYVVVVSAFQTKKQVRLLLAGIAFVGALVSLYGFYQFLFPDKFTQVWLDGEMFDDFMRVYSTLENPNVLGEYFLLTIPLTIGAWLTAKSNPARVYYLGCLAMMGLCMVLTYSRGCYLGIVFAAAVFLVIWDRRFIVPGLIAAVILILALPSSIIQRFASIGNMADSSTSYRVYIWQGTIAMLKDYWFSGVGPGSAAYNQVYPVYAYSAVTAPHAHNLFLVIMCDAGIGGLLVFVSIIYQYFKACFAALRRKIQGDGRLLVMAGIASMVGFMVQSMTDYTFYNYRVMLLFWAVLALGILFTRYNDLREE